MGDRLGIPGAVDFFLFLSFFSHFLRPLHTNLSTSVRFPQFAPYIMMLSGVLNMRTACMQHFNGKRASLTHRAITKQTCVTNLLSFTVLCILQQTSEGFSFGISNAAFAISPCTCADLAHSRKFAPQLDMTRQFNGRTDKTMGTSSLVLRSR